MKKLLVILAVAAAFTSCREIILEDRSECPSFLFFDIRNPEYFNGFESVHVGLFDYPEEQLMAADTTSVDEIQQRNFYFDIRNTPAVEGYGLMGYGRCISGRGASWTTPLGAQYDSLFRFYYRVPVARESFVVPVEFTKEHTKVTVRFTGVESFEQASGVFPFSILVRGNTCGIDALTGLPLRGPFEYRPPEEGIGLFKFILPRQADHDLKLEIYSKPGVYKPEGQIDTFDLWAILREKAGITWEEKNLPDVYIQIDYREMQIQVQVSPWGSENISYEF